ncbi:hypothetical protein WQ57_08380 [Mesobacillus campisalis]|uniref:DUF3888 domain-containing protein n=1 Tax=Mesobacillus campisalis TaxID=1408103 RepID=A0A0M2SVK5_9BACI|nr:hypothetical protein [Mesobacillus campisalis]KKK38599.1 hypothetical protein WQ57_08380 [Mesobacillus campisalis]
MKIRIPLVVLLFLLLCSSLSPCRAEDIEPGDLEKVTLSLLHPIIVEGLEEHYGGLAQFENLKLVKIVPKQLPADLKDDSSFKSSGSAYEITVQLEVLAAKGKEGVTMILSNDTAASGYEVARLEAKQKP